MAVVHCYTSLRLPVQYTLHHRGAAGIGLRCTVTASSRPGCRPSASILAATSASAAMAEEAAAAAATGKQAFRVFFFPFFVASHMNPMTDLACEFAARGVDTTMVLTPANGALIRRTVERAARAGHPIRILHHPFPSAEVGLPEGVENLAHVPPADVGKFYSSVDLLQASHERILREHRPDAVVAEVRFWWATDIARELGIPRLSYHPIGAFPQVVMSRLNRHRPHASIPEGDNSPFLVPDLPDPVQMVRSELPIHMTVTEDCSGLWLDKQAECFGVVLNTFYEFEPAYCDQFRRTECRTGWFVGPHTLWPRPEVEKEEEAEAEKAVLPSTAAQCVAWLDTQATGSVVYVGFGSFLYFTKEQHREMAQGLEASGRPFLWALKEKDFAGGGVDWLPEGFEERVRGRGLVVKGWVPQVAILHHRATGAFVTHMGWNSLTEGIDAGVPLITWPLAFEQFITERLVVDILRLGMRMWGGYRSNVPEEAAKLVVTGEGIAGVVGRFAAPGSSDEEVEAMRRRARRYAAMAKAAVREGGSSYNELSRLIDQLKAYRPPEDPKQR